MVKFCPAVIVVAFVLLIFFFFLYKYVLTLQVAQLTNAEHFFFGKATDFQYKM